VITDRLRIWGVLDDRPKHCPECGGPPKGRGQIHAPGCSKAKTKPKGQTKPKGKRSGWMSDLTKMEIEDLLVLYCDVKDALKNKVNAL